MPIASLTHAALSAAAVAILPWILRRAGPRAAGLAAAVPINSLPALFWLSQAHGGAFAASAALGALCGTGLSAVLGGWVVRVAASRPAGEARCPAPASNGALGPACGRSATLLPIGTAAAMSLLVSELARHVAPGLCGGVAAIPVIGLAAAWAGWRQGGAQRMRRVVAGYLDGMAAKAAFLAVLGAAWTLGAGGWAWGLGAAAALLALLARRPRPRRPAPRFVAAGFDVGGLR